MSDPGGFDLGASISIWSDIRDGIRSLNKRWTARPEVQLLPIVKQGTSGSSGNLRISMGVPGEPSMGRRWFVRKIIVGGTLFTSAPAGQAVVVISESQVDPANIPMFTVSDWTLPVSVQASAALPQNSFYGRGEMVVRSGERLSVIIVGPSANTQYVVVAWVEDVEEGFGLARQAP